MNILIFIWRDELIRVNPENIVFFQADGNYSTMTLTNKKKQLITMNLSKVQQTLDEQLGALACQFERVGRDIIFRKQFFYSIHNLKRKLVLSIPNSGEYLEIGVSKEALKKLRNSFQENLNVTVKEIHLRDVQTRTVYPLKSGNNIFGRKSNRIVSDFPIDNDDLSISRKHFNLIVIDNLKENMYDIFLQDMNSANGTLYNKKNVPATNPIQIYIGAVIRAGQTEFRLEYSGLDETTLI